MESRRVPVSRRTCAVAGPKGGVGRTTVAVNIAVAAAVRGRSVLVVDVHAGVWSAVRRLGCAGDRGGLLAALADPSAEGIRAAAERRHGVLVLHQVVRRRVLTHRLSADVQAGRDLPDPHVSLPHHSDTLDVGYSEHLLPPGGRIARLIHQGWIRDRSVPSCPGPPRRGGPRFVCHLGPS